MCSVPSVNAAPTTGTTECRVPNRPVLIETQVGAPLRSSAKNASTVPSFPPSDPYAVPPTAAEISCSLTMRLLCPGAPAAEHPRSAGRQHQVDDECAVVAARQTDEPHAGHRDARVDEHVVEGQPGPGKPERPPGPGPPQARPLCRVGPAAAEDGAQ